MNMQQLNKTIGHTLSNYQIAKDQKLSDSDIYAIKLSLRELNRAKAALKRDNEYLAVARVKNAVSIIRLANNFRN